MSVAPSDASGLWAYADALHDDFDVVARHLGATRHDVELARHSIRFEFAGSALAEVLLPAFAHLQPAAGPPELTIHAWDRASAGHAAPAPPWGLSQYAQREQIRGVDRRLLRATYDSGHGIMSAYRPLSGVAALYAADAATIPRWVLSRPFRHLLGWWATEVGMTFAHASAVARDGACLLMPGRGGSGKSTTALICAHLGLDFLCDDLCLVDAATDSAYAAYVWAKAEGDAVTRFPALQQHVVAREAGEARMLPPNIVRSARIVGFALPTVTGRPDTVVRPATAAEALFALGPSTLIETNGAGPESLALLAGLARRIPAARLELGTDMDGVVAAVDRLLDEWSR